jgi:replicative DNA helicase
MLEVTLMKLLRTRERFTRLIRAVPLAALDVTTKAIISDMGAFFKDSDADSITMDNFFVYFLLKHPTLTETQQDLYRARLADVFDGEPDPTLERGILGRLVQAEAANNVLSIVEKFNGGAELDLYAALRSEVDSLELSLNKKSVVPWVTDSIADILQEDIDDSGLRWRLAGLNSTTRPLRGGDFVIYAGRVGKGKTTGVMSEVTYMASQFDAHYGEAHGRFVLWLCNEGPGKRIVSRAYQSALNATLSELIEWTRDGTLDERYAAAVGATDRIRVMNVHGFNSYQLEAIFQRVKPGLCVVDMLDSVKFTDGAVNGGDRSDETLEAGYQWTRLMAVKWDCPFIATSQTTGPAAGLSYPPDTMLKGSTTGKQGAADLMIMMGAVDDYPNSRFISIPKTKLARAGSNPYPKFECLFDGERGRLSMPTETS